MQQDRANDDDVTDARRSGVRKTVLVLVVFVVAVFAWTIFGRLIR